MNHALLRRTDLEVVLEQAGIFQCHICSGEAATLLRVRIQEWPTRDCNPQDFWDGERFTIRRRLVCAQCLGSFVFAEHMTSALATIAGKPWCLRQHPDQKPPAYTREKWFRYVTRVRSRRST